MRSCSICSTAREEEAGHYGKGLQPGMGGHPPAGSVPYRILPCPAGPPGTVPCKEKMKQEHEIWWSQVPAAKNFADEILDRITKEKSTAIHYCRCGEWTDALREMLQQKIHDVASMRSLVTVDASQVGEDPGSYLLENLYLCDSASPRRRKPAVERLAEPNSPLGDCIIWVTGIRDADTDEVYESFVSDYLKLAKKKAVFILETEYEGKKPSKAMVHSMEWQNQITHSDIFIFAMNCLSGIRINETMKEYASELTASLCGKDPELCRLFIRNVKQLIRTPEDTACRVFGEWAGSVPDRGTAAKKVWEVQVKVFYPFIEKRRMELVEKYSDQIVKCLPLHNSIGETIGDPEMVEIGAIKSMKDHSGIRMQPKDAARTDELWKMRNLLSHLRTLGYSDILALCEE